MPDVRDAARAGPAKLGDLMTLLYILWAVALLATYCTGHAGQRKDWS